VSQHYGLRYDLTLNPEADRAEVSLTLDERAKENIWSMRFHIEPERHAGFMADGELETDGQYVTWRPPDEGGRFSFHVPVSHRRKNGRFDARMTEDWAVFRGDDLFPPARTDQRDDAEADASLHVHLPAKWSFVTPYEETADNVFEIEHEHRSFDRPTGWMAAGRLGVRRERIAGVRVIVASPLNQGMRRLDILAHLNWNLPEVRRVLPDMPKRLLVVGAADEMWRGGLSGPNSLYVHTDLSLVSENGTSTLVHEVMHVVNHLKAEEGADWIVEGLAEYYSLKLMWRSGTITDHRYKQALNKLEKWGTEAGPLNADRSSGAVTARAVGILRNLDQEIFSKTGQENSLDEVMRLMTTARQKVNVARLRQAVLDVMGESAESLSDSQLGLDSDGG
jgi:hypothetical protein